MVALWDLRELPAPESRTATWRFLYSSGVPPGPRMTAAQPGARSARCGTAASSYGPLAVCCASIPATWRARPRASGRFHRAQGQRHDAGNSRMLRANSRALRARIPVPCGPWPCAVALRRPARAFPEQVERGGERAFPERVGTAGNAFPGPGGARPGTGLPGEGAPRGTGYPEASAAERGRPSPERPSREHIQHSASATRQQHRSNSTTALSRTPRRPSCPPAVCQRRTRKRRNSPPRR